MHRSLEVEKTSGELFCFTRQRRSIMLRIYDNKADIPEALVEYYAKAEKSGKYEPKIEGVNSISGLIAKRDELLEKVRNIPKLEEKIADLEGQPILAAGKIAVDKKEFETLKAEHEAYAALGNLDEIKPKVEGFDALKAKDETRSREETYRAVAKAAGFTNEDGFLRLAEIEKLTPVLKSINENGKQVDKYFVKTTNEAGKEIETPITDYVKESPTFKPFAESLTSTPAAHGQKVIKQGSTTPPTATLETEIAAAKASGVYSSL
jgi:hypothetical protein